MGRIKCLTLTQPWATLVACGTKKIETRSWKTNYRGALAIHAAKGFPESAQQICLTEPFASVLKRQTSIRVIWDRARQRSDFPLGQVIALCELTDCVQILEGGSIAQEEPEHSFGDYTYGRYAWLLENIQAIQPIPMRGALGLWETDLAGLIIPVPGRRET